MLMHVMQEAQSIYGYLPFEIQQKIADGMKVPLEKVYGVATFYAQFALSPKGKYDISVCLGTACYVKGAQELLDELSAQLGIGAEECTPDGKYSLTAFNVFFTSNRICYHNDFRSGHIFCIFHFSIKNRYCLYNQ